MKNKFLLSLVVITLACAGLLVATFYIQTKKTSVSERLNLDSDPPKAKTQTNDLMLWESLSSHLLSLN